MPAIEVQRLSKTYTAYAKDPGLAGALRALFSRRRIEIPAVREISFSIEEGELVGLLGPNGAGKTTALKMLSGILHPTSGRATVLGYAPWERCPDLLRQIAIVMGQKNQLWWDLPPSESFRMLKEIYGVSTADYQRRMKELTELLEIGPLLNIQVRKMSLGERMKCELVAALLHAPRVLFLDEPTIGLDVVAQKRTREFIRAYNRDQRVTILLTSHYMQDVQELCNRVIIIDHGEIVFDDALALLVERYSDTRRLQLVFEREVDAETLAPFGRCLACDGLRATLEVPRSQSARRAAEILTRLPVADITIEGPEAEEVVREIFAGRAAV
ncbi:MAG: ATP-binding cassette domain-containing protein [Armatimonadetes bacterium]|nr:ATP-binding cassette domain-containing protein [Armatimonadota bacterium]